jgi:hypothetical protein
MRSMRGALVLLASCEMFSTSPVTASRDMHLYVNIASSAAGTKLSAELNGPFGTPELGPNDTLSLFIDGAPIASARVTRLDLELVARSGAFTFALHHEGDHDVNVTTTLVPPSNIHATSAGGKLILDWTPFPNAGEPFITVTGTCITPQSIQIETDTGHYELLAAQLQLLPASCALSLGLFRNFQIQVPFQEENFMDVTMSQAETAEGTWTP